MSINGQVTGQIIEHPSYVNSTNDKIKPTKTNRERDPRCR